LITIHGKQVPTHWSEMITPGHTALLIIDMQNDCCSVGGAIDRAGGDISGYDQIIPRVGSFAEDSRSAGVLIIHSQMRMLPHGLSDSPAWLRLRMRMTENYGADNPASYDYMVENTWGEEFVDRLKPRPEDVVVVKYRSSALVGTSLDLILRSNHIQTVLVAGCTTEGCVESTVRDLGFFDYMPIVLADCVGSDVPALHEASMAVMGAYRAEIATSDDVMTFWRSGARRGDGGIEPGVRRSG
jgi:nicotinamidase-related amidase